MGAADRHSALPLTAAARPSTADRTLVSLTPKAAGRVFSIKSLRKAYENVVVAAKLERALPNAAAHVRILGRHARRSVKELQELLGHSTLTMTLRYATSLGPPKFQCKVQRKKVFPPKARSLILVSRQGLEPWTP